MSAFKNIFLCLVHEKPECVIDLVRNLRYFDKQSDILIYNGSGNASLLSGLPFDWYGAEIYPNPTAKKWGWLHGFALDGMRYALQNKTFDTITIVDSDQLLIKKGYSETIEKVIKNNPNIGMLGNNARRQTGINQSPVAIHAAKEKNLWLPLLQTLPGGADAFLYWSFWPSTVFTKQACGALVNLFDTNETLKQILEKTTIWASEEVILPTLVKALGFDIAENPSRYDYVQYKKTYSIPHIQQGINTPNVFWVHPVPRSMQNELRKFIAKSGRYYAPEASGPLNIFTEIIAQTKNITGWLAADEAEVLMETTYNLVQTIENPVVVEVGSYCGKSTCTIGMTALKANRKLQLFAIDPFEGIVGAEDDRTQAGGPTYNQFVSNITQTGLKDFITVIHSKSWDVKWDKPIDFLFVDGLHDYFNVARDFFIFNKWVKKGGYIAFHDYADYYPGVKSLVAEVVQTGEYKVAGLKGTMMLLEKLEKKQDGAGMHYPIASPPQENDNLGETLSPPGPFFAQTLKQHTFGLQGNYPSLQPMVSCITPTYNRGELLQQSIRLFLQQDYENKELIIIDDSPLAIPIDGLDKYPFIKYMRLDEKHTVGEKRNMACQQAQGEIIVHWDDDDWYNPQWISRQVKTLMAEGTEITGLDTPYFYSEILKKAWQYVYPENEKKWVHGATLAYWKKVWQHHPFTNINIGEDNRFVWDGGHAVRPHNFIQGYVGRIHPGNISPKYTASNRWQITDAEKVEFIIESAGRVPAHTGEL